MPPAQRFSIVDVLSYLDRFPFSLHGAAIAVSLHAKALAHPSHSLLQHLRASPVLVAFLAFVIIKSLSRSFTRAVLNHGWTADKPDWEKEVVVVTGGSAGIGKELVEILAGKSDKVAVLDIAEPTYAAKNAHFYRCDISSAKAVADAARAIRRDLGDPTIIVSNAGIMKGNTILETTPEQFLLTYKVNVVGALNILREFLPHLVSINRGHVLTTASRSSYSSAAQLSDYSCSKAATLALHETLAAELVHRYNVPNVRTSVICPGKVYTQLGETLKDGAAQFLIPTLTAHAVASSMASILDSGLSQHVIAPSTINILVWTRSMPAWYSWLLGRVWKAHGLVTDERNTEVRKTYKVQSELEEKDRGA